MQRAVLALVVRQLGTYLTFRVSGLDRAEVVALRVALDPKPVSERERICIQSPERFWVITSVVLQLAKALVCAWCELMTSDR